MKRKRLLALVLAVLVSFTGSGTVSAAGLPGTEQTVEATGETSEELTEGDYTYTVSDGCATITSYSGTEEDVVTPAELGGYPVTKIGEKAFSGSNIRKITISEGIERIEYAAFWKCKELEIINISSSLRVLGLSATTDTTALKEINVSSENQIFFSQ